MIDLQTPEKRKIVDSIRSDRKMLILLPDFRVIGGVANYYRVLDLPQHDPRAEYMVVNSASPESAVALLSRMIRNYWLFDRKLRSGEYGLVVINPSLNPRSYYRDAVFCWLALRRDQRVLVFFRGWAAAMEGNIRRRFWDRFIFRRSFARVRHFVVLGQMFKDRLLAMGCSNQSRFWIETTVADSSYLNRFAISDRLKDSAPLRVLFISRVVPSKGPGIALAAFDLAQRQLPDIPMELIVAGDGPALGELKAFVRARRIEHVIFTGAVHGDDKMDVILRSQILLFPTMHDEGLPNVVLEAMLYGMPVLARLTGSIGDVIEDGVNGFLTERTDPEIFAEWLVKLASEPSSRHAMAIANHRKALRHYASAEVRQRLLRILDGMLNGI